MLKEGSRRLCIGEQRRQRRTCVVVGRWQRKRSTVWIGQIDTISSHLPKFDFDGSHIPGTLCLPCSPYQDLSFNSAPVVSHAVSMLRL